MTKKNADDGVIGLRVRWKVHPLDFNGSTILFVEFGRDRVNLFIKSQMWSEFTE